MLRQITTAARPARVFGALPRAAMRTSMRAARTYSTGPSPQTSDKPWIAASAVIFGGALVYILRPQEKEHLSLIHI